MSEFKRRRVYYTKNQIDSGLVTLGKEWMFIDGTEYIGQYHKYITDEVFSNVTVSSAGCIIYNSSASNKAICVIDFGGTVSATAGDLTIEFPAAAAGTAVIRIA